LPAGTPTETYHAANKEYVDNGFVKKLSNVTTETLVTQKIDGSTDRLLFSDEAKPWYIVRRDLSGQVNVPETPTANGNAASKKYVDDAVANSGGSTTDLSSYVKKSAFSTSYGMKISNGYVMLNAATEEDIGRGTNTYKGITPNRVDYLVKKGLTSNGLTLDDAEKSAAHYWLGINDLYESSKWKLLAQTEVTPNNGDVAGVILDLGASISKWYGETWVRIEMPNPNWTDDMPLLCKFGITAEEAMSRDNNSNGCQIFYAQSKSYGMLFKNYANIVNLFTNWHDHLPSGTQMQSVGFDASNYPYTSYATANNNVHSIIGKRYLAVSARTSAVNAVFPVGTKVLLYGRFPE
jgi:hypothetical protein